MPARQSWLWFVVRHGGGKFCFSPGSMAGFFAVVPGSEFDHALFGYGFVGTVYRSGRVG